MKTNSVHMNYPGLASAATPGAMPGMNYCNNFQLSQSPTTTFGSVVSGYSGSHQMGNLRRLDSTTVRTHFYPEGGWGWIVCACAFLAHVTTSGAQLSAGALHIVVAAKFKDNQSAHWLGPFSWSVSSLCSPLVVNLCRRKSVRVVSLVGGCLFPLSLLFTSFATEIHQVFFCFGLMGGIGSCLVRESSTIVLGEYFRRRRQFAEQVVLAGTGVGVTLFSLLYLSLSKHIEWGQGFQIGAALSLISAILPAFYRAAAYYHPQRSLMQQVHQQQKAQRPCPSFFLPLTGDICKSLKLFCVPSLKPVLWSAGISSFGLYAPAFLMSDFGKSEGLTGGSLLLLQTHLGLGLSLGVILGAILTLKKFRCCHVSPRMLCFATGILTGLSMIAISSVKGYYGYSLSAWIYGIALGSYIYSLKILCMDLTRTKHWERIWSCVQSLMGPGCLIGTGLTSYLGKSSFYACATCVLLGSGILGMELIDLSKCGSPQISSDDNESPIPPAPPLILPNKYGQSINPVSVAPTTGFYPLRRSMSLQQPMYPYYSDNLSEFNQASTQPMSSNLSYSPFCPDCNPSAAVAGTNTVYPPQMVRSFSQPQFRNTGTQTNPNSPEKQHQRVSRGGGGGRQVTTQPSSSSFDQIPLVGSHHFHHQEPHAAHASTSQQQQQRQTQQQSQQQQQLPSKSSQKYSVMFASNPQLFPEHVHIPQIHNHHQNQAQAAAQQSKSGVVDGARSNTIIKSTTSSTRSSTERFPDIPIAPQFGTFVPHQNQEPAFTRHYFDSSQMLPPHKRQEKQLQQQQIHQRQQQHQNLQQDQQPSSSSSIRFTIGNNDHHQNQLPLTFQHQHQNNVPMQSQQLQQLPYSHSPHPIMRHGNNSNSNRDRDQDRDQVDASSILNPNKLVLMPNSILQQPYYESSGRQHLRTVSAGGIMMPNQQPPILYYNPQLDETVGPHYRPSTSKAGSSSQAHPPPLSHQQQQQSSSMSTNGNPVNTNHQHHHHHHQHQPHQQQQQQQQHLPRRNSFSTPKSHHKSKKVSSYEFDIEEPKFHSLRKPISSQSSTEQQLQQQMVQHVSTISTPNHSVADYVIGIPPPYYYIDRNSGGGSGPGAGNNVNVNSGRNVFQMTPQSSTQQQQPRQMGRNASREFDS